MSKVLFVVTGVDYWTLADGTKHPTGFWAEEMTAPFRSFTSAGYEVVVATPGGVLPKVDRASLSADANGGQDNADAIEAELAGIAQLKEPMRLEDIVLDDYAAVFYPGGHGPMEDLSVNTDSARVLTKTLASGKPLGVVCHAPAALLATQDASGSSPFAGFRLTGFTNAEEMQAGLASKAKWLLQDRLVAMGAEFEEGSPWEVNVVVDRSLYTGQNPASSGPVADEMVRTMGSAPGSA
jgi:putative intracellular protease/amidase